VARACLLKDFFHFLETADDEQLAKVGFPRKAEVEQRKRCDKERDGEKMACRRCESWLRDHKILKHPTKAWWKDHHEEYDGPEEEDEDDDLGEQGTQHGEGDDKNKQASERLYIVTDKRMPSSVKTLTKAEMTTTVTKGQAAASSHEPPQLASGKGKRQLFPDVPCPPPPVRPKLSPLPPPVPPSMALLALGGSQATPQPPPQVRTAPARAPPPPPPPPPRTPHQPSFPPPARLKRKHGEAWMGQASHIA